MNRRNINKKKIKKKIEFKIDKFPVGLSKVELDLAEDSLGKPITIFIAKGPHAGPVFGITSTIHGDEINGIAVIKKLFKEIDTDYLRGTIVGIPILNIPGFLDKTRFHRGKDLNRLFNKRPEPNLNKNLRKIIKKFDYLVDLHTATSNNNKNTAEGGNTNSLHVRADLTNEITKNMALLVEPEIILHTKEPKGSLRAAATKAGVSSITIEVGDPLVVQPEYVNRTVEGIENMFKSLKMIHGSPPTLYPDSFVICVDSEWMLSKNSGFLVVIPKLAAFVKKGSVVALIQTVNGDIFYKAKRDGIVIGKAVNSRVVKGSRIIHLGFE